MARPTILTDVLIAEFCSKLRISGSIETAIKTTGIGRESYYGWARAVRAGGGNKMQKRFMAAVDEAEGETKLMREHMLSKHFEKSWQSIAWFLERRFPLEYGQQQRSPLPVPDDGNTEKRAERVVWTPAQKKKPPIQPTPQSTNEPDAA